MGKPIAARTGKIPGLNLPLDWGGVGGIVGIKLI